VFEYNTAKLDVMQSTVKNLYERIYSTLSSVKGERETDNFYHKYDYHSFGLKTPVFREMLKSFRDEVKALTLDEAKQCAVKCFEAGIEEMLQTGIWALAYHAKGLTPKDFPYLKKLAKLLNSWSTVDSFAPQVVQPPLLKYPEETADLLRYWNKSRNLWERRLSVVVFTPKAIASTGKFTDLGLELCEAIINDEEDLVRKGIGWALKDLMEGDRKKVLDYVKDLRRRGVSATITLYAIERIKREERKAILGIERS
jgi:3-methyladenine DNA glycosylase AlkD